MAPDELAQSWGQHEADCIRARLQTETLFAIASSIIDNAGADVVCDVFDMMGYIPQFLAKYPAIPDTESM